MFTQSILIGQTGNSTRRFHQKGRKAGKNLKSGKVRIAGRKMKPRIVMRCRYRASFIAFCAEYSEHWE
jgi:hypothetical protein